MKKIINVAMAIFFVAGILSFYNCGGSSGGGDKETETAKAPTPPPTYWTWDDDDVKSLPVGTVEHVYTDRIVVRYTFDSEKTLRTCFNPIKAGVVVGDDISVEEYVAVNYGRTILFLEGYTGRGDDAVWLSSCYDYEKDSV